MEIRIVKGIDNSKESIDIRTEVFINEQKFENEFDEIDETAYHLIIFDNNKPVATGRMYSDADGEYHIGRIAVIQEYRKKGIGRIVVTELEKAAAELGAEKCSLSAQTRVSDFYRSLGYTAVGEPYFDEYCPHIKMIKKLK